MNELKLENKKIGRLTVLTYSHTSTRRGKMWLCQCECGNQKLYSTSALNRGKAKSCGCLLEERQNKKLIGLIFGELTVKEQLPTKNKQKYWLCECSCGKKLEATTSELRANRRVSCGCKPARYKTYCGNISSTLWKRYIRGAQERGIEFNLTMQEAWDLYLKQNEHCALSGVPINIPKKVTKEITTASLDRIDSSKGYEINNVQWVHKTINMMKNAMTTKEFTNWCKLVTNHTRLLKPFS